MSILILVFSSCQDIDKTPRFTSLDPIVSGVSFVNELVSTDSFNLIGYLYFYNGSGVGAGDFDRDGKVDLVFGSNQQSPELYRNITEGAVVRFENVSGPAGLNAITGWDTGIAIADVNGDGWLDIYICQLGDYKNVVGRNRLLINSTADFGSIRFEEKAVEYGLDFRGFSTHAAFFDYDRDGDLDMYLLNHSVHDPGNYGNANLRNQPDAISGDKLYRNDDGYYVDVSIDAGIYSSKIGYGLGVAISDLNGDSWPDIYVTNDFHENDYLYLNLKNGSFQETIQLSTGHTSQFSMGVDIADINNDLRPDILTLDMMPPDEYTRKSTVGADRYEIYRFKKDFGYHYQLPRNHLHINRGNSTSSIPLFSDLAPAIDIESTDWSWSGLMADFDNDGLRDIYITNGILKRPNDLDYLNYIANPLVQSEASDIEMASQMPSGVVSNIAFNQKSNFSFTNITDDWFSDEPTISNGATYADLDNDGDHDIITNNINSPASILINGINSPSEMAGFLHVRLDGLGHNSMGIGARLTVFSQKNTRLFEHYVSRGFMSSTPHEILISKLNNESLDSIYIEWPSGRCQTVYAPFEETKVVFRESEAHLPLSKVEEISVQFELLDLFNFEHQENNHSDFDAEKLQPFMISTQGPPMASGDINGDGLDDVFIGGGAGSPAGLFIQTLDGSFKRSHEEYWVQESQYEDTDAKFVDIDADGDQDLIVASGGNHAKQGSPFYANRIYKNDGTGGYTKNLRDLPYSLENTSCIAVADFDSDGDQDIFFGTRNGNYYGDQPDSYILINDGEGIFKDQITLEKLGMVSDGAFGNLDEEKGPELVVAGEWMPITVISFTDREVEIRSIENSRGLWFSLDIKDIDGDGQRDIVAGNFGLNHDLFSDQGQLKLYVNDFDKDGRMDPIITYLNEGREYPIMGKEDLSKQMVQLRKTFPDFRSFAVKTFDEIFERSAIKSSLIFHVEDLKTRWYKNSGKGQFTTMDFPSSAQMSPMYSFLHVNLDKDPTEELIMAGNLLEVSPRIGSLMAGIGVFLDRTGEQWVELDHQAVGIDLRGPVRNILRLKGPGPAEYILVGVNNGEVRSYRKTFD